MALLFRGCTKYLPAQVWGGGIGADEGRVKLWLSQCEFLGNKANGGGVIALLQDLKSAEVEISFCSFKSNRATGVRLHACGHSDARPTWLASTHALHCTHALNARTAHRDECAACTCVRTHARTAHAH